MKETPWIGLAALLAMFLLPYLPSWLFEGPRKIKHYPHRHVCGRCGAAWVGGHICVSERTLQGEISRPKYELEQRGGK